MLAIGAARYQALRRNPGAIKDEVMLRQALDHLAAMSFFKQCASEREVLAEIRIAQRNLDMIVDPMLRRQMAERYAREDALVDAALARGDRERPLTIGSYWKRLKEILAGGEDPDAAEHFFLRAPKFGEDVGYGPAGLHDPSSVAAFASYLELWTPERFGGAAAAHRPENLPLGHAGHPRADASHDLLEVGLFHRFRSYILAAAAASAGMLIWLS